MSSRTYIALALGLFAGFGHAENTPHQLVLGVDFQGRSVQDNALSSQAFGVAFVATHQRDWFPSLESNIRLRTEIETGSGYSAFSDPYGARQRFVLDEASLAFTPLSGLTLKAGALSHRGRKTPLLIDSKAFLGVSESLRLPYNDFFAEVSAEQSLVPGNSTAVLPDDRGALPYFLFERLRVGYAPTSGFQTAVHISHFRFSGLGNDLANEARVLGNTVSGVGKTGTRFSYGFEGVEGGLEVGYRSERLVSISLLLSTQANLRTTESRGRAITVTARGQIPVSDGLLVSSEVSIFHAGSDAAPANFLRSDWGYANRRGFSVAAGGDLVREQMHLRLRYTDAAALAPTPYQSSFQFIGAEFGVEYGLL